MQNQGIEGSKEQKEIQSGGKRRAMSDLPWDTCGLQRTVSLFPPGFLMGRSDLLVFCLLPQAGGCGSVPPNWHLWLISSGRGI